MSATEENEITLQSDELELQSTDLSQLLQDNPNHYVPLRAYKTLHDSLLVQKSLVNDLKAENRILQRRLSNSRVYTRQLTRYVKHLDELEDNVLYVSVRELEVGLHEASRMTETVLDDFLQLSTDNADRIHDVGIEGLMRINAQLEGALPHLYLERLFEDLDLHSEDFSTSGASSEKAAEGDENDAFPECVRMSYADDFMILKDETLGEFIRRCFRTTENI